ncbi:Lar family restriction alleviation protein [Providencia rettgeri]
MMSKRIKNCPMCGNGDITLALRNSEKRKYWVVCCTSCHLNIDRSLAHLAIDAWNRRANNE